MDTSRVAETVEVHVEVYVDPAAQISYTAIEDAMLEVLQQQGQQPTFMYREGMGKADLDLSRADSAAQSRAIIRSSVDAVRVADIGDGDVTEPIAFSSAAHFVHITTLSEEPPMEDTLEMGDEEIPALNHYSLPNREFDGSWEALIFDSNVKRQLLQYATTAMLFADHSVDQSLISFNRVLLLHGPPGTGKTSLCKALGQKLAVRLSHRYTNGAFLEINSHSLFSKWFSESGKLVQKLFERIRELAEDPSCLCLVLVDEVESLTASRKAAAAGTEPSDAVRVVNALLTQLDQLKRFHNVLVVTTSNITGAIDAAFVDRADLKLFIGNPSSNARYEILRSAVNELVRVGLVVLPNGVVLLRAAECDKHNGSSQMTAPTTDMEASSQLYQLASICDGLSGRALRKLPFIAFSQYCRGAGQPYQHFVGCLRRAAESEHQCREAMQTCN